MWAATSQELLTYSPDFHDPADAGEAILGPVASLDHGEGDVPV